MNRGSAKHNAEESPNKATTSKKVFLRPNGLMLMRTIVNMVIISTGCASPEGVKWPEASACSFRSATRAVPMKNHGCREKTRIHPWTSPRETLNALI